MNNTTLKYSAKTKRRSWKSAVLSNFIHHQVIEMQQEKKKTKKET